MTRNLENYREDALNEVKLRVGSNPQKIALMYSGGMDSSAVYCSVAAVYPQTKISLLVCNNGHYYPEEIKSKIVENVNRIIESRKLESPVSILYFDFRDLLIDIGIRHLHQDMEKYSTCYLCCACKVCMHFVCSLFCQREGIPILLDGYNHRQRYYPEQVPEFQKMVSDVVWKLFEVKMCSPLYDVLSIRDSSSLLLSAFGLNPDFFNREKGGQASCSLGGCCRPPRKPNGEVDMDIYNDFVSEIIGYTSEKIEKLCSGRVVIQNREGGKMEKPPYPKQVEMVASSFERIL